MDNNREKTGAQLVAEALTGADFKTISVAGRFYMIPSPTIHRLAGCVKCLSAMRTGTDIKAVLLTIGDLTAYARALSWLIRGDESLTDELAKGTPEECVRGVEKALELIDIQVFTKAVTLQRYVARMAAANTR